MVLAPDLDGGPVHEDVNELCLEGVADREDLVVDGDDPAGPDAAQHPLSGVILGGIDRHRDGVDRDRARWNRSVGVAISRD